jgi:hypothetical protein
VRELFSRLRCYRLVLGTLDESVVLIEEAMGEKMTLNVAQRGVHVATFRWIEVRFMETLAGWTPTTRRWRRSCFLAPTSGMPAQHADALGKRTHELRLPLQHSVRPVEAYVDYLDELRAVRETDKRIAGFYDCALPALRRRFGDYLSQVDQLLDGPTVRCDRSHPPRHGPDARGRPEAARGNAGVRPCDARWLDALRAREAGIARIAAEAPAASPRRLDSMDTATIGYIPRAQRRDVRASPAREPASRW